MKKLILIALLGFYGQVFAQCSNEVIVNTSRNYSNCLGTDLIISISISNVGDNNRTAEVKAEIPSGLTFVSATISQGTYNSTTGLWSGITLGNQQSAQLHLTCSIKMATVDAFTATALSVSGSDCNTANNTSSLSALNIASCDHDGDGVNDMDDQDDDNDGTADELEYGNILTNQTELLSNKGLTAVNTYTNLKSGNFQNGSINQLSFTGDAFRNVKANNDWILVESDHNGNSQKVWEQTISNVKQKTSYLLVFYTSNASNPAIASGNMPNLSLLEDGQAQSTGYEIPSEYSANNSIDTWVRHEWQFVPNYGTTSMTLAIYNDQIDANAFALAGISLIEMNYSALGGDPLGDTDGDSVLNYLDDNFCGLNSKNVSACMDYDGDGIINSWDIDSDNDGLTDLIESNGKDANGDGRVDNLTDMNFNGLSDDYDTAAGGAKISHPDFDNDGVINLYDLDSDNDGIPDLTEQGGKDADANGVVDDTQDDDADGLVNAFDVNNQVPGAKAGNGVALMETIQKGNGMSYSLGDADHDGLPNSCDLDSDNDGILDIAENGGSDADLNGLVGSGSFSDDNSNGWANITDPANGGTAMTTKDTDGDGIPDFIDNDNDNDGIADIYEVSDSLEALKPTHTDTDQDGIDDIFDTQISTMGGTSRMAINSEGSDAADFQDTDSDNDGIADYLEGLASSKDALIEMGVKFCSNNKNSLYANLDADKNNNPDWLDLINGYPAFLVSGSAWYFDTDRDGLVDLFDQDNGGFIAMEPDNDLNGVADFRERGIGNNNDFGALPITLVTFNGVETSTQNHLTWVTSSEQNSNRYEIERATSSTEFAKIGELAAAGNSINTLTYNFNDTKHQGTSLYRLKMIDNDGKVAFSKVISFNTKSNSNTMNVWPIPTAGEVNINFTNEGASFATITITDITGKLIYTENHTLINGQNNIQLTSLTAAASGIYQVSVSTGATNMTQKIIKK
jgi:hypothetical protein